MLIALNQQQQRMEQAESLDIDAGIHGNWALENAKAKANAQNSN